LLDADLAQPFQLSAVVESDEMDALVVKTLPHLAAGRFAEAFQIPPAIVARDVVFARDVEYLLSAETFQDLVQGIELRGLCRVGEVPGMKNQIRLVERLIDLADRQPEGAADVGIRRPVEADVAIADLNESEIGSFRLIFLRAEQMRTGHASSERPDDRGTGPLHTFQNAPPVHGDIRLGVR
jgi:hypothetical protein